LHQWFDGVCQQDHSNSFRPSLSEHKPSPLCQKLRSLQKSESYNCSISRPKSLLVHFYHPCRLFHNFAMYNCLVPQLNSSRMSQNGNVSIELPCSLRLQLWIHQHHPLPNLIPLHFFQSQRRRLPRRHLYHIHSVRRHLNPDRIAAGSFLAASVRISRYHQGRSLQSHYLSKKHHAGSFTKED